MAKQIKMKAKLIYLLLFVIGILSAQSQDNPSFTIKINGSGKNTAILVPGYSCSGEVWETLINRFQNQFTFHTITFAGFAGEKPQQNPSLKKWIDDIASYIAAKKMSQPIIVGHSLGGVIAMDLAARYPDRVSKIIVVDALPSLSAFYNPSFKAQEVPDCVPAIRQFTSMNDQQFYTSQKYGMYSLLADTSKLEKVVSWSVKSDRATLGNIYCQFANYDLRSSLSNIKCPTLILLEPSFKATEKAIAEQFSNIPKQNHFIRYATKGLHFIMYDDSEWFLNEVNNFVK